MPTDCQKLNSRSLFVTDSYITSNPIFNDIGGDDEIPEEHLEGDIGPLLILSQTSKSPRSR